MLKVSALPKTWIIDIDGTIFLHNGHLTGDDVLLPGAAEFISRIPEGDHIILMTARSEAYREVTLKALARNGIRYGQVIFALPTGERVLINDRKPSGLATAHAINIDRDAGLEQLIGRIEVDDTI